MAHHEVVVRDRSVLDNYAHWCRGGRQKWLEPLVNRHVELRLLRALRQGAQADGIRDTDEFFMKQIDRRRRAAGSVLIHTRLPEGQRGGGHSCGRRVLRLLLLCAKGRFDAALGIPPSARQCWRRE